MDYNLEDALFLQVFSGGRLSLALRNNQLRQQLRELPLRDGGVDIRWMHNDHFEDLLAAIANAVSHHAPSIGPIPVRIQSGSRFASDFGFVRGVFVEREKCSGADQLRPAVLDEIESMKRQRPAGRDLKIRNVIGANLRPARRRQANVRPMRARPQDSSASRIPPQEKEIVRARRRIGLGRRIPSHLASAIVAKNVARLTVDFDFVIAGHAFRPTD